MPIFGPPKFFNNGGEKQVLNVSTGGLSFDNGDILNQLGLNGDYVSADDALHDSDVYAIISRLSFDLVSADMTSTSQKTDAILKNPTPMTNQLAFWQSIFAQLLLGGEAFAYIWRNKNAQVRSLEYLRPSQVQTMRLADGSGLIYNATFDEPCTGFVQAIPSADMLHFRLMSSNGGKTGISPLSSLGDEFKIKREANRLSLASLAKSVFTPGVLKVGVEKGGLQGAVEKTALSRSFMTRLNASNGGPIVLDELEEFTPFEVKNDISKLLASTDWTRNNIAKVYGVDDSQLNGKGDQQSSIQMQMEQYIKSLRRFAVTIEAELSNKLHDTVKLDLRPVYDILGSNTAREVAALMKEGALTSGEAKYLLKERGYLSQDFPNIPETNPRFIKEGGTNIDNDT